ncbi:Clusterin-associated protein 1 [Allomyces javanicus]|nr:Clusterin-associated protein 1 [Allomyces javanicus]
MSFRDVRALTERMRFLGYPNLISVEAFRQPNFELVAELLVWLVKSYDPQADISVDISTEPERVNLVKSVAQFLASKAQLKLNLRKLYAGDGTAVKELLKLTDLFMAAQRVLDYDARGVSTTPAASKTTDLASKLATIKAARDLASDITNRGAVLFDLLGQELENRELRSQVLARPIDLPTIEAGVRATLRAAQDEAAATTGVLDVMASDAAHLQAKIDKRRQDLDRRERRLKSMQGVRPAWMDEFERLEMDLAKVYKMYADKHRNVCFLEQQVEEQARFEMDRIEETESSLRRMQDRIKEEELKMLRGGDSHDDDLDAELFGQERGRGGNSRRTHMDTDDSLTYSDDDMADFAGAGTRPRLDSFGADTDLGFAEYARAYGAGGDANGDDASDDEFAGIIDDDDDDDDLDDDEDQDMDDDVGRVSGSGVGRTRRSRRSASANQHRARGGGAGPGGYAAGAAAVGARVGRLSGAVAGTGSGGGGAGAGMGARHAAAAMRDDEDEDEDEGDLEINGGGGVLLDDEDDDDEALLGQIVDYGDDGVASGGMHGAGTDGSDNDF